MIFIFYLDNWCLKPLLQIQSHGLRTGSFNQPVKQMARKYWGIIFSLPFLAD